MTKNSEIPLEKNKKREINRKTLSQKGLDGTFRVKEFKILLKKHGFTANSFGKSMGVAGSTVRRWIIGETLPTLYEYIYMCRILRPHNHLKLINLHSIDAFFSKGQPALYRHRSYMKKMHGDQYTVVSGLRDALLAASGPDLDGEGVSDKKSLKSDNERIPATPAMRETKVGEKSKLFTSFPIIKNVNALVSSVSHPTQTEESPDGFNCTFEVNVDRIYNRKLAQRYPDTFRKPDQISRCDLIMKSDQHKSSEDVWLFIESGDVYDWRNWDVLYGVEIFNAENLHGENKRFNIWYEQLSVDNAKNWRKEFYDVGFEAEPEDEDSFDEVEESYKFEDEEEGLDDFEITSADERNI